MKHEHYADFPPRSHNTLHPPSTSVCLHFTNVCHHRTSLFSFISAVSPLHVFPSSTLSPLSPSSTPPLRFPPPALSPSLVTVTGKFASLLFCGRDKGGRCPLAGYVTGCHMRRTLWDSPALSAVTTQITSTASHLISTSNSISGN